MASLLARLRGDQSPARSVFPVQSWNAYLAALQSFSFNGITYPLGLNTTYGKAPTEEIATGLSGHLQAVMTSPPAFAAQWTRSLVLSQARFTARDRISRATFGTAALPSGAPSSASIRG
jgi:hypothetical protein